MPHSPELPAALGDVFTVAQAARHGLSRGQLARHPHVLAPFIGVRMRIRATPDDEPPWETRRHTLGRIARAAALILPPRAFFSHTIAAALHGMTLPLPDKTATFDMADPAFTPAGLADVSVLTPRRGVRIAGITSHELGHTLFRVVTRDGLRMSSPASTWAMMADRLDVEGLVILGDSIVRRDRIPGTPLAKAPAPMATIDDLAAAARMARRRNRAQLCEALTHIREGSSSDLESLQRMLMDAAGLPAPTLDHDVRDESGRLIGCTEITYPTRRIAIECEGDHHRTSRAQWDRDIAKYQAYAEAGWLVVRVTGTQIRRHRTEAVRRVAAALRQRGWSDGEAA